MTIDIVNQQKIKRVDLKSLTAHLNKISRLLGISLKKVSLLLCDNKAIKKLNKKYFKKNSSTDVISFSLSDELDPDYLGEIIVSVEEAVKVSAKLKISWKREILLYIIHGMLHLLGYKDHNKKERQIMRKKEEAILKKISL